jgi:WD40 repeat protein
VAFSPDGQQWLATGGDETALLWDPATGRQIRTFTGHATFIYAVAFSPNGQLLATGSYGATTQIWD